MIGTSLSEYVFIRACIVLLRVVAPLSIFYTVFFVIFPVQFTRTHHLPRPLEAYFVLETCFYLLVYLPLRARSQFPAAHPKLKTRAERQLLFKRCAADVRDPELFLERWFLDAPKEEIKRDNVAEWIRWGFFNQRDVGSLHEDEVQQYVDGFEEVLGRKLEPGKGKATAFRLTFDQVHMSHRPFVWYIIIFIVDSFCSVYLLFAGFTYYRLPILSSLFKTLPPRPLSLSRTVSPARNISYWYRPHKSKTRLPVLFIHGIGVGLHPYLPFLSSLAHSSPSPNGSSLNPSVDDDQIGILALEILPISARLTSLSASTPVLVREIHSILLSHGWSSFVLATHSYGSAIATNLLHSKLFSAPVVAVEPPTPTSPDSSTGALQSPLSAPPRIAHMVLIDPITILLHLPAVAYNFTKRAPRRANEHQLWYFASTDMGVAHTLGRHFFWSENVMWKDELMELVKEQGMKITVGLAGRDLIVDTAEVKRYLLDGQQIDENGDDGSEGIWIRRNASSGGELRIMWFETYDHAQVFDYKEGWTKVKNLTCEYVKLA